MEEAVYKDALTKKRAEILAERGEVRDADGQQHAPG